MFLAQGLLPLGGRQAVAVISRLTGGRRESASGLSHALFGFGSLLAIGQKRQRARNMAACFPQSQRSKSKWERVGPQEEDSFVYDQSWK